MFFLPFDAFGAFDKGKQQAIDQNWQDLKNYETIKQDQYKTDLFGATQDGNIAGINALNSNKVLQNDIYRASQPGSLANANLFSTKSIDMANQATPYVSQFNKNQLAFNLGKSDLMGVEGRQGSATSKAQVPYIGTNADNIAKGQSLGFENVVGNSQNIGTKLSHDSLAADFHQSMAALGGMLKTPNQDAGLTAKLTKHFVADGHPDWKVVTGANGYEIQDGQGRLTASLPDYLKGKYETYRDPVVTRNAAAQEAKNAGKAAENAAPAAGTPVDLLGKQPSTAAGTTAAPKVPAVTQGRYLTPQERQALIDLIPR
jgi:hypothetical protein